MKLNKHTWPFSSWYGDPLVTLVVRALSETMIAVWRCRNERCLYRFCDLRNSKKFAEGDCPALGVIRYLRLVIWYSHIYRSRDMQIYVYHWVVNGYAAF